MPISWHTDSISRIASKSSTKVTTTVSLGMSARADAPAEACAAGFGASSIGHMAAGFGASTTEPGAPAADSATTAATGTSPIDKIAGAAAAGAAAGTCGCAEGASSGSTGGTTVAPPSASPAEVPSAGSSLSAMLIPFGISDHTITATTIVRTPPIMAVVTMESSNAAAPDHAACPNRSVWRFPQ